MRAGCEQRDILGSRHRVFQDLFVMVVQAKINFSEYHYVPTALLPKKRQRHANVQKLINGIAKHVSIDLPRVAHQETHAMFHFPEEEPNHPTTIETDRPRHRRTNGCMPVIKDSLQGRDRRGQAGSTVWQSPE